MRPADVSVLVTVRRSSGAACCTISAKSRWPDAILLTRRRLTGVEFEQMKQHTIIGDRLCGELRLVSALIALCKESPLVVV